MTISMAALLKRRSPLPAYGHGWIMTKEGQRWHPTLSKQQPAENMAVSKRGKSWLSKLKQHWLK
ncbi:phage filamentation protein Fil family protein [Erwinia sp. OPT-41]|uniref:Phage filamentation protein Fil family protein n=1 Tax=Erwinia plantamica TaxID=3237104 RepID=A0ABW7CIN1_9GAMM